MNNFHNCHLNVNTLLHGYSIYVAYVCIEMDANTCHVMEYSLNYLYIYIKYMYLKVYVLDYRYNLKLCSKKTFKGICKLFRHLFLRKSIYSKHIIYTKNVCMALFL